MDKAIDYRATLNLPQTNFNMKANLAQNEPNFLKRWEKENLYGLIQERSKEKPLFILHDGPPYANGHIHLGHALNKILKDIILRSRRMAGFNAPYVPGWDCHGLPIEHNVDMELGEKKKVIPKLSKRNACRKYAEKWIKTQKAEFKRLGILGDWENPYLTMAYGYEAVIAKEFNKFLLSGAVVRNKKPVYWCTTCTTALAEAEVEYANHRSHSVFVKFPVDSDLSDISPTFSNAKTSIVIWTTTPWTLPANLAVAFHPDFVYAGVQIGDEIWIMAKELIEKVMQASAIDDYQIVAEFSARQLENRYCRHPFMDRQSLMVLADYVTLDAGTGCVHTAPGHGAEDFLTGQRYGLDILSPVDDEGTYTQDAGKYAGQKVPAVNKTIVADLADSGMLVHQNHLEHSYPHCWRCKKPVMYRATPQWFISMENNNLRKKSLNAIEQVTWTPAWGMQRIYSMIENRPDWCLSRQRSWGVPITVISCKQCGKIVLDERIVHKIDELFTKEGADAWFKYGVEEFIGTEAKCEACGCTEFVKEEDILDVWFDSGVSHAAVCESRPELTSPADLYLEGSDQHRGWFHSSLLTSVGTRDRAPYKGVLTHGYVVDGQGKKMSKSVGNVIAPSEVIEKYGAEILRLWVASEDYKDDIKVSDEILRHISDSYRKIRNTIRYLLSNLYDFDPQQHRVAYSDLSELDKWAMSRYEDLRKKITAAYEEYEFHGMYHVMNYFCGTTMSAFYLDIIKDRLYASGTDSQLRRSTQTVLFDILNGMLRLMSPVLCFTAAEAWESLFAKIASDQDEKNIFLQSFPEPLTTVLTDEEESRWLQLLKIRGEITKALEIARRDKIIGHPLEAKVLIAAEGDLLAYIRKEKAILHEISIVSELEVLDALANTENTYASDELSGLSILVQPAAGEKCERCWTRSLTVGKNHAHPMACERCIEVLTRMEKA